MLTTSPPSLRVAKTYGIQSGHLESVSNPPRPRPVEAQVDGGAKLYSLPQVTTVYPSTIIV